MLSLRSCENDSGSCEIRVLWILSDASCANEHTHSGTRINGLLARSRCCRLVMATRGLSSNAVYERLL